MFLLILENVLFNRIFAGCLLSSVAGGVTVVLLFEVQMGSFSFFAGFGLLFEFLSIRNFIFWATF
jgi:hypothetical protein